MRVVWMELEGEKHPLCYNLTAVEQLCEHFGTLDAWRDLIFGNSPALALGKTIEALMMGGRAWCKQKGVAVPPAIDDPSALIDITDMDKIKTMFSAIQTGQKREVEVEAKNAEPTQGP